MPAVLLQQPGQALDNIRAACRDIGILQWIVLKVKEQYTAPLTEVLDEFVAAIEHHPPCIEAREDEVAVLVRLTFQKRQE